MLGAWMRRLTLGRLRAQLDVTWITPDWGVGAAPPPHALPALAQAGFGSVLDLRAEVSLDAETYAARGLRLNQLAVEDGEAPTQAQLADGTAWILKEIAAGRRVLICCRAGSGRSVTLGCAVLMAVGYPLSQTLPLIALRRPVANPTEAQLAALHAFAARLADLRQVTGH